MIIEKEFVVKIVLAPMQGYLDAPMRELLTQVGGLDEVVSEFVRITHTLHGPKVWRRMVPELMQQGKTLTGTPCVVQILGSCPEAMAENAAAAVACGALKIDINFGCPSPVVNQHQGGAILLNDPKKIYQIVRHVAGVLPENIRLSAKMRLGYQDTEQALDCARAIEAGGAKLLTVHARTKIEGYEPPAHWEWFARIKEVVAIPLIANGDIFTLDDFKQLLMQIEPDGIMLGRGILRQPALARQIAHYQQTHHDCGVMPWHQVLGLMERFFGLVGAAHHPKMAQYALTRTKQWLRLLLLNYPEAELLFQQIRSMKNAHAFDADFWQSHVAETRQ